jgi:putative addiction module component (TIGR02574 family)
MTIFELSPAEKLQLAEDLWDDLAASPADVPVHEWQKAELERRKANLQKNPASGLSWLRLLDCRDCNSETTSRAF